jgi:type III secretion protein V
MAAGLVVTRSAGDEADGHLGESIGRQIAAQPRALLMTGCVSLLLALVPGFPAVVFIGIAVVAFLLARHAVSRERGAGRSPAFSDDVEVSERVTLAQPLAVEIRVPGANRAVDIAAIRGVLSQTVSDSSAALGIQLPNPGIVVVTQSDAPIWRISIFDAPVATSASGAGFELESLQRELAAVLTQHAERFVGVQEVSNLLEAAGEEYPALVREVTRQLPAQKIAEVLRLLLREHVPVRNLRDVLEALAEWSDREKDPASLAEFVRVGLKTHMTSRFADAERRLRALVLDGSAEELIRRALKDTPAGVMLVLAPEKIRELRASLRSEVERLASATSVERAASAEGAAGAECAASVERAPSARGGASPGRLASGDGCERSSAPGLVLVTSIDVRRHVRTILEAARPSLPVISYQELLPDVELQPIGVVRFQTETA